MHCCFELDSIQLLFCFSAYNNKRRGFLSFRWYLLYYYIQLPLSTSSVYWYQGILPWIEPWAKNIYDVPRTNWYSIGTSTQWGQNIYKVCINWNRIIWQIHDIFSELLICPTLRNWKIYRKIVRSLSKIVQLQYKIHKSKKLIRVILFLTKQNQRARK